MPDKPPKRPRDLNQWAKRMVDLATGTAVESADDLSEKNPQAVKFGREGGLKGGKSRATKLTPKQRKNIAKKAAEARWKSKT